jgi:hypothetical protein
MALIVMALSSTAANAPMATLIALTLALDAASNVDAPMAYRRAEISTLLVAAMAAAASNTALACTVMALWPEIVTPANAYLVADTDMVLAAWINTDAFETTVAPTDMALVAEIETAGSKEPLE